LSGDGLVAALLSLGDRIDRTCVLMPCTDGSVDTLSRERVQLKARFILPLAPHDTVHQLMDKVSFARHAAVAGLPVPRTEVLEDRSDAELVAASMTYPSVLKPPGKAPQWLAHTSAKGFAVHDAEELLSVYDRVAAWAPVLLAQEWVAGGEDGLFSCNAYFDASGRAQATFVARKVRQWPPDIGTSASGEECRNDDVLEATLQLFGGVGFHGLAYLEMKRDTRTGRLLIIEPNVGRPTGRSAISEAGGVELVYTAYCDAAGLPLPPAREQRYVGTKWLDLRRDVQAALVARRRGTLTLRDWARSLRGPKAHAIWSARDPMPFAADLAQATSKGAQMAARRILATARAKAAGRGRTPHRSRVGP
jgi:predicted ATP-grasp superfamily ATP-dependent carboligase